MKWHSPLPRLTCHAWRCPGSWYWGAYLSRSDLASVGLALMIYLGPWTIDLDLTWPERSKP